jgi:hypothetical protein
MLRLFSRVAALAFLLVAIQAHSAEYNRPFWTEKSSYIEGVVLYAVGVATQAKTQEEGRQGAYENGKKEVSNFAQVTDLSGLNIETQMTFEETNPDGTRNVFRLLKVDMQELTRWKTSLLAKATTEMKRQNEAVSEEVSHKREQIELLERQTAEVADLDARAAAIKKRLTDFSVKVDSRLRCGMTMTDVVGLLGRPQSQDDMMRLIETAFWNYGEKRLTFHNGILVSIGTNMKEYSEGRGCSR